MNLIDEARTLLEGAGYRTHLAYQTAPSMYFEDDVILGAVFTHSDVASLIEGWERSQDRFLGENSASLRSDPVKAWNVYTIHLTSAHGSLQDEAVGFAIEQDFRGTRKIVRFAVSGPTDVRDALLPILPLQNRTLLSSDNVTQRLKERLQLAGLDPSAFVKEE